MSRICKCRVKNLCRSQQLEGNSLITPKIGVLRKVRVDRFAKFVDCKHRIKALVQYAHELCSLTMHQKLILQ